MWLRGVGMIHLGGREGEGKAVGLEGMNREREREKENTGRE